jgi:hypothetical protein
VIPVIVGMMIINGSVTVAGRAVIAARDRDGEGHQEQDRRYMAHGEFSCGKGFGLFELTRYPRKLNLVTTRTC